MLRAYTAAFLAWRHPDEHIWHATKPSSDGLSDWLNKIKPDVIVADCDPWYNFLSPENKACGFMSLAVRNQKGHISGIYQNSTRIAKCAIDLLVRARYTHDLGEPEEPVLMLTAGTWIEGSSLLLSKK